MDEQSQFKSAQSFLADLTFERYFFNKVEFTHNEYFKGDPVTIDFVFSHHISLNEDQNNAFVSLSCTVFPEAKIKGYPFTLNVEMVGAFSYDPTIPQELRDSLVSENALAIMFPYMRSMISSVTASAGIPPLVLPAINISKYIANQNSPTESVTTEDENK